MQRLIAGTLALLLIACGGDDDADETPEPTPTETITAASILEDAVAASANLETFHFKLTQENATIPIPPNLDLESAEGDLVLPDRLKAELESDVQGINVSVDAIAIGSDTWITNPFTRQYQHLDIDLRDFADLGGLLPVLLPAIEDPTLEGTTTIDGDEAYKIVGTASSSDLQEGLPFALPDREVRIELWLGVDDLLPRRVRVIGELIAGEGESAVREISLSKINQPVEINPP
jgi:LppX_LprAFG lipoprotein